MPLSNDPKPPLTLAVAALAAVRIVCFPLLAVFWVIGVVLECIAEAISAGAHYMDRR